MSVFYEFDRNFILSQNQIWHFSLLNVSEAQMYSQGCYKVANAWYKDFPVNYNGVTRNISALLEVDEIETDLYNVRVAGVENVYDAKDAVSKTTKALGLFFEEAEEEFIAEKFGERTVSGILTAQGYVKMPYHFIEYLYQELYTNYETGPNPYQYESIVREDGAYLLIDWDNTELSSVLGGNFTDNQDTAYGMSPDDLYEWINELFEDVSDELMQNIKKSDAVKIMFRTITPTLGQIDIVGYDIDNNTVYVSDNGASMSATVTKAYQRLYDINNGTKSVNSESTLLENRSITFKNTAYSSYLNIWGGSWSGTLLYGRVYDSIGWQGELKPFTTNGQTPTGSGLEDDYPSWATNTKWLPVSDDDPDQPDTQVYYQIGRPGRDRYIRVYPSPNDEEEKPSDKDTDDDTRPDVDGLQTVQGLYSVYKLNGNHVRLLGNWLWDSDGVNLNKLLQIWKNDPLQSIISLHQLYFDPFTSGEHSIVLGNVDTEISVDGANNPVKLVPDRYQHLECGFIYINRYFNDFRDYQTKISIYLPFIGIRELDVYEVMGSVVELSYYIDVLTGDCTATLSLNRDKRGGGRMSDNKCLYMWNGNCAAILPVTANDKSTLYRNVGQIGKGVVGTIAGAISKSPAGIVNGIGGIAGTGIDMATSHQMSIEKSGSLGSNFGAMGYKKPYLIIEKPLPVNPVDRGKYVGLPCHKTLKLADVSGYTVLSGVHVDTIGDATDQEKNLIDNALRNGVIL